MQATHLLYFELASALAQLGLPVSFCASSARWGVEKPSPGFFDRIVEECQLPPERIAYVGDRLDNDVLPARRAGMFAVFVRRGPWGHVHAHWPEVTAASASIESLAELPELIIDVSETSVWVVPVEGIPLSDHARSPLSTGRDGEAATSPRNSEPRTGEAARLIQRAAFCAKQGWPRCWS